MSYCVNCGVKLAESEPQCPLCGVAAVNPASPWREPTSRPYPERVEKVVARLDRRFIVSLASLFLLIPVLIPLIADLLVNDGAITWSGYVIGASVFVFVSVLLPFLFRKPRPYVWWMLDSAALAAYLALIAWKSGSFSWYLPLGLPIVGAVSFSALLVVAALSARWTALNKAAALCFTVGLFTVLLDYIITNFTDVTSLIHWSFFVAASCAVFAAAMMILDRHKTLKDEIRRRLFY